MGAARQKKLLEATRMRAYQNKNGVFVPRVDGDTKKATWPTCMTCHRDVEALNVEDVGSDRVTIRARCHGQEAVFQMLFPFNIRARDEEKEWDHIQTAINGASFFDPSILL